MSGKKPDFEVKVGARDSKYKTKVGAAWKNQAGGINVVLDPGIALVGGSDAQITLWPPFEKNDQRQKPDGLTQAVKDDFGDEDIPF